MSAPAPASPSLPRISYPDELPVSARREDIAEAIRRHQVVVVAGETGSGKTTQLPKICLELGRRAIAHTQPRRIAARAVAERIAQELGTELGGAVGYRVRFTDRASRDTLVTLMTDGILLNELGRDRTLSRYDTIIIDEAHERSLNIDFLLGYLVRLLPQRPELKVIVTSATIDPESFARHFGGAPVIEVSGRSYPVEIRYRPLLDEDAEGDTDVDASAAPRSSTPPRDSAPAGDSAPPRGRGARDLMEGILDALEELEREPDGDVLVFLSGETEIRDAQDAVSGWAAHRARAGAVEVVPLYGRLTPEEQHRVFRTPPPGTRRRVVLATNVAETSLTVPGIRYVIDAGTARISRYSARAGVQRLPIEPISQASAAQRAGRSGRTAPGIAIRLYAQEDFERRPEFTDPEIVRTSLASVILRMAQLRLGRIEEFPFLQAPDARGIAEGLDLLDELSAIETGQADEGQLRLTAIGHALARLPIEPRFARMIVEAERLGVRDEVTAIVAGLSVQDPRERPAEARAAADSAHARFTDPGSDFLTLLNLWRYLGERQAELSGNAFRRMCRAEYLNVLRVREWQDVNRQLSRLAAEALREGRGRRHRRGGEPQDGAEPERTRRPLSERTAGPGALADAVHRSILTGLLGRIGVLAPGAAGGRSAAAGKDARAAAAAGEYLGARGRRFSIFPGSVLAKRRPAAVMAAELVETSRLFARVCAAIDPAWAERPAGERARRTFSEPRWDRVHGSAVADERVTLYGVPIVPKRRIQFARVDPVQARELFIRHALVAGEWPEGARRGEAWRFERENAALRREVAQAAARGREGTAIDDDEAVFAFFDARIPAEIASARAFEGWWRTARAEQPGLLDLSRADLPGVPSVDQASHPDHWRQGEQRLPLRYRFEPGAPDDGVTAIVPLALLPRLEPADFTWMPPGLRAELATACLRLLPKALRRHLVPAAEWAQRLLAELPAEPDGRSFVEALAATISRTLRLSVAAEDFDLSRLPEHLRMRFQVVDADGRVLGSGRQLQELQQRLADRAREAVAVRVQTQEAAGRGAGEHSRTVDDGSGRAAARPQRGPIAERAGLRSWELGELPAFVDVPGGGRSGARYVVRAYPALVPEGDAVALRLLGSAEEQAAAHPAGVRRLLRLALPSPLPYVQEHLTAAEKLSLASSPYPGGPAGLLDDGLDAIIADRLARLCPDGMIRSAEDYERVLSEVTAASMDELFRLAGLAARILDGWRRADRAIRDTPAREHLPALQDARAQLDALVFPGFLSRTGLERLPRLPVYLEALRLRLERLPGDAARDRARMAEVRTATERYLGAGGTLPLEPGTPAGVVSARWLLEELRVSLWAQQLGTAGPVSLQRIVRALTP